MTKDSVELCGGTHARNLGEIGLFKIESEGGVAAGVRRIEAATGLNALGYVRELEGTIRTAARAVKSGVADVAEKVEKLVERDRQLDKEISDLKRKLAMGGSGGGGIDEMISHARPISGGRALAVKVDVSDPAMLRELAEKVRDKLGDCVVLLGAVNGQRASLVLTVSKSLTTRNKAGELV